MTAAFFMPTLSSAAAEAVVPGFSFDAWASLLAPGKWLSRRRAPRGQPQLARQTDVPFSPAQ
jgi:hypothetical protein